MKIKTTVRGGLALIDPTVYPGGYGGRGCPGGGGYPIRKLTYLVP
ncbi:hypothetical protein [Hyalangium rubrum]|uniref:Uncharacterized protein n=1 Tax=Hyalangium rubrum TaxID=3103134 RepID=A0ABU5HD38_9BACT|nr:hypothetical protein [Hyalangium sp. s54d21]MDY7230804.1 hypothetical protein [Hyalangium sp. s54d21]